MAPSRCALSLLLLFASAVLGEIPSTYSRHNHQSHQHRAASHHHHHRNQHQPSWSHRAHDPGQYPHARHNHSYALLRRADHSVRSAPYHRHNASRPTAAAAANLRPAYQRLISLDTSESRSIAYTSAPSQQQNLFAVYPRYATTQQPSVYTRYQPGRRVCSSRLLEATSEQPQHQLRSRQKRQTHTSDLPSRFACCPGWTQITRLSFGCNQPVCSIPCQNRGVCSAPGKCTCPKGFTGSYCHIDVDECVTEKPCDQICRNVPGTYECYCRSGYELQPDRHACRKNDSDGTALEAKDLVEDFEETITTTTRRPILRDTENDVGEDENEPTYEELVRRLIKLEKQLAKGKKRESEANEIQMRIASAMESINGIRRSVQNIHAMQQEVYDLRNKVKMYEYEIRKIQYLTNKMADLETRIRLRCRSNVYLSSGSSY